MKLVGQGLLIELTTASMFVAVALLLT